MSGGAAGLASRLSMLPRFPEAAAVGASQLGINVTNVGQVNSVAVVGSTVVISLPATAVAMVAQKIPGAVSKPVASEWHEHHIATDKWIDATHSGGPWTPGFKKLFDQAGMSLNDPANKVRIRGHQGPHPEEYHREVFRRLRDAMRGCRSLQQCRDALTAELKKLGQEISTEGTYLNKLITRSE